MNIFKLFSMIVQSKSGSPVPPTQAYYNVSGTADADGDYTLASGTHGTTSAVYTTGTRYLFYDTAYSMWGINPSTTPGESGGPPPMMFWMYYDEMSGGQSSPPTGTYACGQGSTYTGAVVSALT